MSGNSTRLAEVGRVCKYSHKAEAVEIVHSLSLVMVYYCGRIQLTNKALTRHYFIGWDEKKPGEGTERPMHVHTRNPWLRRLREPWMNILRTFLTFSQ